MKYQLTFDEAGHEYWLHSGTETIGRCASVTLILKAVGAIGSGRYTPGSAERGTLIHKMTEVIERGDGDEFGADYQSAGEYAPYLVAYALASLEINLKYQLIEQKLFWLSGGPIEKTGSSILSGVYAGTADRIAILPSGELCVIDLKSGKKEKWHRLQLAAYRAAAEQCLKLKIPRTAALYLDKDGGYNFDLVPADDQPGYDLQWGRKFAEWERL